jgi:hypothetical protein
MNRCDVFQKITCLLIASRKEGWILRCGEETLLRERSVNNREAVVDWLTDVITFVYSCSIAFKLLHLFARFHMSILLRTNHGWDKNAVARVLALSDVGV